MSSTALVPTLVRPSNRVVALTADAVLVALGVTVLALSAQVSIPLPSARSSSGGRTAPSAASSPSAPIWSSEAWATASSLSTPPAGTS